MQSAIVFVDDDDTSNYDLNQTMHQLRAKATSMKSQFPGVEVLGSSCWLVNLETSLPFFSVITGMASQANIPFKVSFLEQPTWITYGKGTTSNTV